MVKNIKIIAFYLPQFHPIKENDEIWGKGFTEWTNVKKASAIHKKQIQPHVPYNNNYYDLLDANVMRNQAKIAQKYGVDGFCYYHYYFKNGKKLLEKPIENMLKDKKVDIPFCLSWANEPWSKRWNGSDKEVFVKQDYGDEKDWEKHFQYLLPFFQDRRYIMASDSKRPLFLIYKPSEIPNLEEMLRYFNKRAIESGFNGMKFMVQFPEKDCLNNSISDLFEGIVEFEPIYTMNSLIGDSVAKKKFIKKDPLAAIRLIMNKLYNKIHGSSRHIYSYDNIMKYNLNRKPGPRNYPGLFPGWDNTPRRGKNATVYLGNSPEKFGRFLKEKLVQNEQYYNKDIIFVNAWNEWGEGAYLEPDVENGYAYLEQIRQIKNS